MDKIALFLQEASTLNVTFTIDARLARELPPKSVTVRAENRRKDMLLVKRDQVSIRELPIKLQEARFWLPRAYRKRIEHSNTQVNAVFHLVKCICDVEPPYDPQSKKALQLFENLCSAEKYQVCLFDHERIGSFGLHCVA